MTKKQTNRRSEIQLEQADGLGLIRLRGLVLYPATMQSLLVNEAAELAVVARAVQEKELLAVFPTDARGNTQPVGSSALIVTQLEELDELGNPALHLLLQGAGRIRMLAEQGDRAIVAPLHEGKYESNASLRAIVTEVRRRFVELLTSLPEADSDNIELAGQTNDPSVLAYLVASIVPLSLSERQQVLETDAPDTRLAYLLPLLEREAESQRLSEEIRGQARESLNQKGREAMLREQLRLIQRALGEEGDVLAAMRQRVTAATLSPEARQQAARELAQLARLSPGAPEYNAVYTYLEWLLGLPWQSVQEPAIDLAYAAAILDRDHYGLAEVKSRLLDYLAVRKLRRERAVPAPVAGDAVRSCEPILCLVGPPGVGKTSLGLSIAAALGREFVRLSLGGVHDEAEIRGHRRTYVGALPGRLVQAISRAGVNNPVVMLDEIDKLTDDQRGSPASALLEVLDQSQNSTFRDNYLEVPFDLSHVLFVATANQLDSLPGALRDRLEVIEISGYTEMEKVQIASRYLVPRQLAAHALEQHEVDWPLAVLRTLIRNYTREAGVRELEREIAAVCRRLARRIAEGGGRGRTIKLSAKLLVDLLGKPRYLTDTAEMLDRPGIAIGLAWTSVGGDIVYIEASKMPGHRQLTITGQLGEVMKESAQAALSYVRAQAAQLQIDPNFFDTCDLHLHLPAGAIPKDGPSAGITIAVAIASMLTGRPVPADLAMTGEITLRGRVLPIGGVREKLLAAHRAGLKRVIVPAPNRPDLDDLPAEIKRGLEIIPVESVDEVFAIAVCDPTDEKNHTVLRRRQLRLIKETAAHEQEPLCETDIPAPLALQ